MPRCPNEGKLGNNFNQLRITGGFWKEQRRRSLQSALRQSIKIKKELEEMEKNVLEKNEQIEEDEKEDSTSESN